MVENQIANEVVQTTEKALEVYYMLKLRHGLPTIILFLEQEQSH